MTKKEYCTSNDTVAYWYGGNGIEIKEYKIRTGRGNWCNDAEFQYFVERLPNDKNGNTRHEITVILFDAAVTFTKTCMPFECKQAAESFVANYLESA